MDTKEAINLAGSPSILAKILNVSPSAVTQWRDTLPDLRVVQLYALRPEWFKGKPVPSVRRKAGKKRKPAAESV
jgi:hypothetical protein